MGASKGVRIAILINCLEIGGAQKMALTLFEYLRRYYDVYLVQIDKEIYDSYMTDASKLKNHIILTPNSIKSSPLKKILWATVALVRLIRFLEKNNISTVLSLMERANILNLLVPLDIKKIISIRNYPTFFEGKHALKRLFIKFFYKFSLKRAHIINFNSIETKDSFKNMFNVNQGKLSVIYNFIDKSQIEHLSQKPISDRHKSLFNDNVIINVANLSYQKAQARLIRAFSYVIKKIPDARLLIIGGGSMFKELQRLVDELELKAHVYLFGFIKNPFPYIKMSKIFVLSSQNEGFPNSLLEAMALGKPVISTDCSSGPREILAPDTDPLKKTQGIEYADFGILVPSFNRSYLDANVPLTKKEILLAEVIIKLLSNEKLRKRYSLASFERIKDFLPENILPLWHDLL